jgi:hypothetical protein
VICDSFDAVNRGVETRISTRTREYDERVYILHISKLLDGSPCEVLLGLQMSYRVGTSVYSLASRRWPRGSMADIYLLS